MSKFRTGDIVDVVGGTERWRLELYAPRAFGAEWRATGEKTGRSAIIAEALFLPATASPHYTPDASGKDYLARCEETYSRDEMIGAYRFTIGKYVDRMGKKQGEPGVPVASRCVAHARHLLPDAGQVGVPTRGRDPRPHRHYSRLPDLDGCRMIRTAKNLLGVAILLAVPLVMAAIGLAMMLALSVMIVGV